MVIKNFHDYFFPYLFLRDLVQLVSHSVIYGSKSVISEELGFWFLGE